MKTEKKCHPNDLGMIGRVAALLLSVAGCATPAEESDPQIGDATSAISAPSGVRPIGTLGEGSLHGCSLGRAGTVYCSGLNYSGELGDGTNTNRSIPVQVTGLTQQVYVTANGWHSCAAGADGQVHCWGFNGNGQLGDGNYSQVNTPQSVRIAVGPFIVPLTNIVEVQAGWYDTCARNASGAVFCWGWGGDGELGNGATASSPTAVHVSGISNAIALAVGGYHACALLADHTVACWGENSHGQLGNGSTASSSVPVPVTLAGGALLANVEQISATNESTCALLDTGNVRCWGAGSEGQLGNGTTTSAALNPTLVRNASNTGSLSNVVVISSGGEAHTCAIHGGGVTECWGDGTNGDLGNGSTAQSNLPVTVGSMAGVSATVIAAGGAHTCARTAEGLEWCWGNNGYGQLGDGTTQSSSSPVVNEVPAWLAAEQRIMLSYAGGCAISSNSGTVYCWGNGSQGWTGNAIGIHPTPVSVGVDHATSLAGGDGGAHALRGNGSVWCWGYNGNGECGNGTISNAPNYIAAPAQASISNVIGISSHCALKSNGTVWCWGLNQEGEVGNGTTIPQQEPTPTQVVGLTDAVAISGTSTPCALRSDGTVWCWGHNGQGQVGNGTTSPTGQLTPAQVTGLSNVVAVSSGGTHACALESDGSVWCWGQNPRGELGDGTTTDRLTPVRVLGLSNAIAVSASEWTPLIGPIEAESCAILADGTVRCWGNNERGQLGNGSTTSSSVPVQVSGLSGVIEVAAGHSGTFAMRADGTLWAWGWNDLGYLGIGTTTGTYPTPIQVPLQP